MFIWDTLKVLSSPSAVFIQDSLSHWAPFLRHEPTSPAQTLDAWVRVPLKKWMHVEPSFCVYIVLFIGRGLVTGWSLLQSVLATLYRIEVLATLYGIENLWNWPRPDKKAVELWWWWWWWLWIADEWPHFTPISTPVAEEKFVISGWSVA
jgi:hypothetical protein